MLCVQCNNQGLICALEIYFYNEIQKKLLIFNDDSGSYKKTLYLNVYTDFQFAIDEILILLKS